MTYPEDTFIEQMALGKLVIKHPDGKIRAGSLEGLILEIIQVGISYHGNTMIPLLMSKNAHEEMNTRFCFPLCIE